MRFKSPQFLRLRKQASVRSPNGDMNADREPRADEAQQAVQKKLTKRRALIAAVAAAMVLILGVVPVTYSYLTSSSDTVVNTFAGGAISLTLDEAKVDTDGEPIDGEPRVQENTYKVIPGATLYKDPTVTVLKGSEVCYVYLYVENPLDADYFTLDYSSDWTCVATTGTKTLYVYKTTVDAAEEDVTLTPIFTEVEVSGELTAEQIEAMGEVQIKVQAYVIQTQGVDSATATQMAADYFEEEFGFEWTDVDTAVDIDGLTTEEEADSGDTEEADTSSDTADEESSSDETDTADTEASDEASDETNTSAEESDSEDISDGAADSASSEESSEDDTAVESSESSGSDVSTESTDSSGDAATLDIIE